VLLILLAASDSKHTPKFKAGDAVLFEGAPATVVCSRSEVVSYFIQSDSLNYSERQGKSRRARFPAKSLGTNSKEYQAVLTLGLDTEKHFTFANEFEMTPMTTPSTIPASDLNPGERIEIEIDGKFGKKLTRTATFIGANPSGMGEQWVIIDGDSISSEDTPSGFQSLWVSIDKNTTWVAEQSKQ
jgi:hypothetical protein